MHKRRQDRGWHQYFLGFRRRINCESVPRLPAIIVRYFLEAEEVECGSLVWRWMYESQIKESLTLRRMPGLCQVELTRSNGTSQALAYTWHSLPRNGGRGLMVICPRCKRPRRFLYGWKNDGECVRRSLRQCRECAGLPFSLSTKNSAQEKSPTENLSFALIATVSTTYRKLLYVAK